MMPLVSNVIDIKSGQPVAPSSIPELRRDFSRRLAKCTDEIDALYTEALNSDGYTNDVLALDGEVVDRMARQLNELKRRSKAVR